MAELLKISTHHKLILKPLVLSALEREKKLLALGIQKTHAHLEAFERKFGMTSVEFARRLQNLELTETVEFTDWRMEIGMLQLLQSQYQALEEAQLD